MTDGPAQSSTWFRIWLFLSLLWIAAIAYVCFLGWPAVSLDLSAGDPQVQAAYTRALTAHLVRHALLAIAPPVLLLALGWGVGRLGRRG